MPINVITKIGKNDSFSTHCRGYLFNHIRDYRATNDPENYPFMIGAVHKGGITSIKIINHGRYQKIKKWIRETIAVCFPDIKVKKILINYNKKYVKIFIDYFPDIKRDVLYVSTISLIARLTLKYILFEIIFSPEYIPFIDATYGEDIVNLINFTKEIGHTEVIRAQRKMLNRYSIEGHNGLEYTINELIKPFSGTPKLERIKKLISEDLIKNNQFSFNPYIVLTKDIPRLKKIINVVSKDTINLLFINDHKNGYSSIKYNGVGPPAKIMSILRGYVPVDMPEDSIKQIKEIVKGN